VDANRVDGGEEAGSIGIDEDSTQREHLGESAKRQICKKFKLLCSLMLFDVL
jgi:hypothetical protein